MEQLQMPILWLMLAAYVGACIIAVFYMMSKKENLLKVANTIAMIGLVLNSVSVVLRAVLIQGLPLNNGYEFGLCFGVAIMIGYIVVQRKFQLQIGAFVFPIVVILSCWLVQMDLSIHPTMPALRSYWLAIHVSAAVIAYGTFAISFAVALAYMVKEKTSTKDELQKLDEAVYKAIFIGLPFLTIMLVTGAVWAQYAWGAFWSWDPKETWALITWLIYAGYLHARFIGWQGKKSVLLAIIGFIAIMFTLFGVSYLLPGMHSYLQ